MSLPLRYPLDSVSFEKALEDLIVRFIINVPPEDLATVERELFHFEEALWFYTDFIKIMNPHLPNLKFKTFASCVISMCPLIWKWQDVNPEEALQKFSRYKKSIPVRGAAIFNQNLNKILLVKGMESDSWSFPRGKISKDEDDVHCCIREVMEEIGFDLTNYIDDNQYIERNINGKNYKIYLVAGVPEDFAFKPQVRNEIEKIEWRDFRKLSCFLHKSNAKYYLLNSMLKPLSLWVKKQTQIQTEEQLIDYAEEQLKLLLGISTSEGLDPEPELVNTLQSSVREKDMIQLGRDDSHTSMSTFVPATYMAPSSANSQIPVLSDANRGMALPFPFTHGFSQGMFSQPIYGVVTQKPSHLLPLPITQVVENLQTAPQLQNITYTAQSPHTPIVKPTILEDAGLNSRQLLDLLKNPKKSEPPPQNNSARTLLNILIQKDKISDQGTRPQVSPDIKNSVKNEYEYSQTPNKAVISPKFTKNPLFNGHESSPYRAKNQLAEKLVHSDFTVDCKEFESGPNNKIVEVHDRQPMVGEPARNISSCINEGDRLPKIKIDLPSGSKNISLEHTKSTNANHNDKSAMPSYGSEKPTRTKPKFKLLRRGEKFTSEIQVFNDKLEPESFGDTKEAK